MPFLAVYVSSGVTAEAEWVRWESKIKWEILTELFATPSSKTEEAESCNRIPQRPCRNSRLPATIVSRFRESHLKKGSAANWCNGK
jgi:hypothetical protein